MLFNSIEFIIFFLPVTFAVYFFLLRKRLVIGAKGFLVAASLFFYSWWNINYLPLLLFSVLFNFLVGNSLNNKRQDSLIGNKRILIFGIIINLSLLAYFKYTNFFIDNVNYVFNTTFLNPSILLPLAISFFTFQQIAYLVDSYKGKTREYDFLNYTLFVTFFPQLIAGPIVHHKEMMPQFFNKNNYCKKYKNIAIGIFIFSMGMFKKVIIADNFSIWATDGFSTTEQLGLFEAWATSLSYTFQLYFDFSAYTDMAIGAALLFNIKLPINFNSPYKAVNIQDFWRRWHITLSRFLQEYIYIPLGGNRKGDFSTYNNIAITFLIGGIWHGASWMFVFWGALHGMAIICFHLWGKLRYTLPKFISWLITFNFINLTWVFFRAEEWVTAKNIIYSMFFGDVILSKSLENNWASLSDYGIEFGRFFSHIGGHTTTIYVLVFAFILIPMKNTVEISQGYTASWKNVLIVYVLLMTSLLNMHKHSEFLYFNF